MKRFRPLIDKLFWIILIPTILLVAAMTVVSSFYPTSLLIIIPVDLFVIYMFISPLFGYVELREKTVYIKYGLILKKEIPYDKIRETVKERRFYSDSMMSLKNSFEHINIKYNTFDVTGVSVIENDVFVEELNSRIPVK